MTLPCRNEERVTKQVQPTIELLTHMDEWHPDVLKQHTIEPADYHEGLVFRSAIESIRGSYIASSTTQREGLVGDVLENLLQRKRIAAYQHMGSRQRHDFTVIVKRDPMYEVALEVKGGEGNSINISVRPIWAEEFGVWCHLDGAIVNQPAHGAHSIISRLTNELVKRQKQVDVLFFKDILCGTRARPCPKYPVHEEETGLNTAPDVFLFPRRVPTLDDPEPPVHTPDTLKLPWIILGLFGVEADERDQHVWEVHVRVVEEKKGQLRRFVQVTHQGKVVDESRGRPWLP